MGRIVGENKHKGTLYPVDSKAIYRIIYEVVAVLPTENIKTSVIYCVPIVGKDNEYDMFLYINGWSKIGSGSIDLSDYYTKEEVDDIVADISTLSFKIVQEKPIEDIETNVIYLIPKNVSETGNIYEEWIYIDNKWELLGTTDIDLSNYMDLAPLNPTAEQISAMSSGQLYGDTVNHKGTIKDGQSFYDTVYIDENYRKTYTSPYNPPIFVPKNAQETLEDSIFKKGDRWVNKSWGAGFGVYVLNTIIASANPDRFVYDWRREYETWYRNTNGDGAVPSVQRIDEVQYQQGVRGWYETPNCLEGAVLYEASAELGGTIQKVYKCYATRVNGYQLLTYWAEISVPENYYTKTEIDSMIPTVPTNISAFTNDSGYLTLGTLPIYDGTVI